VNVCLNVRLKALLLNQHVKKDKAKPPWWCSDNERRPWTFSSEHWPSLNRECYTFSGRHCHQKLH